MTPQFSLDFEAPAQQFIASEIEVTTKEINIAIPVSMEVVEDPNRKISAEEKSFEWFILELIDRGLIDSFTKQPEPYQLSLAKKYQISVKTKTAKFAKVMPRELIRGHYYTSDFKIIWNKSANHFLHEDKDGIVLNNSVPFFSNYDANNDYYYSIVEVKADFDQNNMTRLFSINQKWVLDSYGVYIELAKIPDIFKNTFVPLKAIFTPKKGDVKKYRFPVHTCDEYLKGIGYGQ